MADDPEDIHRQAVALRASGRIVEAMAELRRAFHLAPSNLPIAKEFAEVSFEAGDYDSAKRAYRALSLQDLGREVVPTITQAEVFLRLGEVHLRAGEEHQAVAMFERALKANPGLERARQLLAEASPSPAGPSSAAEATVFGLTPDQRFGRLPLVRAGKYVMMSAILFMFANNCVSDPKVRRLARIAACGASECTASSSRGKGNSQNGGEYRYVVPAKQTDGSPGFQEVTVICSANYFFRESRCTVLSRSDWSGK